MRRLLASIALLITVSSCDREPTPLPQSALNEETWQRYTTLVAAAESHAKKSTLAQSRAESAARRAESAADRAEDAAAVEHLDALVEAMQSPEQPIRKSVERAAPTRQDDSADDNGAETAGPKSKSEAELWAKAASGFDFLYFTAEWCPACQMQQPVLERLRANGYRVRTVDIDALPGLANQFNVSSIPAYVAAVDGDVVLDQSGKPKISHGMTPTPGRGSWRVNYQAVLNLIDQSRPPYSATPFLRDESTIPLKQIVGRHDWKQSPAYVGDSGNLNRQDYVDHLQNDHGYSVDTLADWTTFELFQLHSALHCPECSQRISQ